MTQNTPEHKKTILIVDDDKSIISTFMRILQRNGYDVDKAETGNEAMEKINHRNYDLALIDLKLPDIEGTELLLKIPKKANKMAKIIVTGFSNVENGCRAAENGADEYLVKPVKPEELLKVISDYTT